MLCATQSGSMYSDVISKILGLSTSAGYHPVVSETDYSLEIEARLDPDTLLLLEVWPSGAADGLIYTGSGEFKIIPDDTATGVLHWLLSELPATVAAALRE